MAKRGLGRGIEALIRTDTEPGQDQYVIPGARVAMVSRMLVHGNPNQPRKEFAPEQLQELADSIREKGILQPLIVEEDGQDGYMVIAGERRLRAAALAGLDQVPVIIHSFSEEEKLEIALIENIQRENLTPLEEAKAYRELMEHFALSQEDVAKKVGKSRPVIANALRLLKLSPEIQEAISRGTLSPGHARAILAVTCGEEAQTQMFRSIMEFDMTVREAESLSKLINAGTTAADALPMIRTQEAGGAEEEEESPGTIRSEQDILALSSGARLKSGKSGGETASVQPRDPALWDLEEQLIRCLGTKVSIKGDAKSGKIEIQYYSMEDLERVFDLIRR